MFRSRRCGSGSHREHSRPARGLQLRYSACRRNLESSPSPRSRSPLRWSRGADSRWRAACGPGRVGKQAGCGGQGGAPGNRRRSYSFEPQLGPRKAVVLERQFSYTSLGPLIALRCKKGDTNSDPCYNRKVWAVRPIATQYPQLRVAGMDPAIPLGTWLFPQARAD
jgi:hypothetical protein